MLFKVALVILGASLAPTKVRKRCAGLCETLEVLRSPPTEFLEVEFLFHHMSRLDITEEDFEYEHKKQTTLRKKKAMEK